MARMGRPRSTRTKLAAAIAVLLSLAAVPLLVTTCGPGSAPPGQPPLVRLADISRFDAEFDAACNQIRLLVLLSPT